MKCINCENSLQTGDMFCRKCGTKIHKYSYYVFANVFVFLFIVLIIAFAALFIASFLV